LNDVAKECISNGGGNVNDGNHNGACKRIMNELNDDECKKLSTVHHDINVKFIGVKIVDVFDDDKMISSADMSLVGKIFYDPDTNQPWMIKNILFKDDTEFHGPVALYYDNNIIDPTVDDVMWIELECIRRFIQYWEEESDDSEHDIFSIMESIIDIEEKHQDVQKNKKKRKPVFFRQRIENNQINQNVIKKEKKRKPVFFRQR